MTAASTIRIDALKSRAVFERHHLKMAVIAVLALTMDAVAISLVLGLLVLPMRGQSLASAAIRVLIELCLYSMPMGPFAVLHWLLVQVQRRSDCGHTRDRVDSASNGGDAWNW